MAEVLKTKKRSEIEDKYKWKLEDLFLSLDDWERDFSALEGRIGEITALKDTITNSAEDLASGLKKLDAIGLMLERLYVYARMGRDMDNANGVYQALTDRISTLAVKISTAQSFLNPTLLKMDCKKLRSYLDECPEMSDYRFYIEDLLRSKEHILSDEEERLLSLAGDFSDGAHDIFTMLNNADLRFSKIEHDGKEYPLTHASYIEYMQSEDRELRKKAYEAFYEEFKQHKNKISATYATSVKKDVFYAKARKFDSPIESALFSDDVDVSVYDKLISDIHRHLPTMHRFVSLRKRLLGYDELHMYDIYAPLVPEAGVKYTYEEAVKLNLEAMKPLGEDYMEVFSSAFRDGWIDVFENEGKTTGAYSWGAYGTHPYVLLNHRDDLDSVFTIAHEMGHAMHSYYSNKTQPYATSGYTIFVAEVASTVNEILMTKYLLKTVKDKKVRRYVLNHYLDQFRTTVVRQTMFAEFEKISHEMALKGEPLTVDELSRVYGELNAKYHGPDMKEDDIICYEWMRIPHFYTAFYVYKYATGLSCAVSIVKNLDKPGMLEKYRKFLCGGGSKYPLELLADAGVSFDT
ncbi:MAG: oligoendopeptidase F, partial [Lachnospiraceae bacterium]